MNKKYELSILIPARCEEFLGRTIQDLLEHTSDKTEIIAILDGYLPDPPLEITDPRVTIIYNPVSIGQRAATNQAARLAKGKYLIKLDAHVAVDEDFDTKMIDGMKKLGDDVTLIPIMRNLHVFNWVCPDGHERYQGPSGPCKDCNKPTTKDVVWIPKTNPSSKSYRFDKTMHFQYYGEYKHTQEYKDAEKSGFTESMSIQGSCFMCTKEKYFELGLCGEDFHSWGQQGVEVACKTWLSGGKVMVNHNTWYAHCFRTQGGDFSFPYKNPQSKVNENREISRELFQRDKWPKATRKFQWLLDKFNPPDWTVTKGAIFYTDSQLDEKIAKPVREQLEKISREKKINITCSSLKKMDFGGKQIRFPSQKRGYLTMFRQIVGALENSTDDIIFFTEHDVLYHPSHFDFDPPDKDTFYYNVNVWRTRLSDGHSLKTDDCKQLSGLCGHKHALLTHFKERHKMAEEEYKKMEQLYKDKDELERNFNKWVRHIGFEPMTHNRIQWKNQFKCESWESEKPNIDLKHGANATGARWKKEQYKNQKWVEGWTERENDLPGWGDIRPILDLMR